MKNILVITAVAVVAMAASPTVLRAQAVAGTVTESYGLSDLDAMTFGCPKAALNAAAREAAKVPSQGTYQFAYFTIVNDSHDASYEVHFKSNYFGEPDLKYCVSVYCQQGWEPKTTKISVRTISGDRECGHKAAPVKRRPKR